jgi:hypothetical protein
VHMYSADTRHVAVPNETSTKTEPVGCIFLMAHENEQVLLQNVQDCA